MYYLSPTHLQTTTGMQCRPQHYLQCQGHSKVLILGVLKLTRGGGIWYCVRDFSIDARGALAPPSTHLSIALSAQRFGKFNARKDYQQHK